MAILSCDVSLTFCIRHCHIKRDDCLSTFYSTIFVTFLWYLSYSLSCSYWGLLLPILQNGKFLKDWDQRYTNSLSSQHLVQGKYSVNVSTCVNSTWQKNKWNLLSFIFQIVCYVFLLLLLFPAQIFLWPQVLCLGIFFSDIIYVDYYVILFHLFLISPNLQIS